MTYTCPGSLHQVKGPRSEGAGGESCGSLHQPPFSLALMLSGADCGRLQARQTRAQLWPGVSSSVEMHPLLVVSE
jgi:hypothetical protein